MKLMKIQHSVSGCLFLLTLATALAQQSSPPAAPSQQPGGDFSQRLQRQIATQAPQEPGLTKFDLDFPGGTPKGLIAAIQKASGRPLNAIVPEEFADTRLPALKMKNVDVPHLFQALTAASEKHEVVGENSFLTKYGFQYSGEGRVSDDAIWNFFVMNPPNRSRAIPKVCRFYSLARYLDTGTTVDDITTAVKTGAQMLDQGPGPGMNFHKDTKLLIAVGEPSKLEIIDSVLRALDSQAQPIAHAKRAVERGETPKDEKK